ncbi:MAG: hypothetical protein KDK91_25870, partial [Gammaproteobacteria bacterium]|nr:hypothetical protein [Gammaproteobacteria bacterium]
SPVGQDQARARLGAQLRAAVPLLDQGRQALNRALLALRDDAPRAALAGQSEAIARLSEAREHFLDLRQLIELVHARERGVAAALAEPGSEVGEGSENEPPRIADALLEEHARNVERSARLGPMITDEALSAASGNGEQPAASGGGQSPQAQQLQQAYTLWGDAQQAMYAAQTRIEDWHRRLQEETTNLVQQDPAQLREQAAEQAQDALDALTALRRLFFSLLEHLKDTASRQQELLDRTDGLEAESGSLDTTAMRARAGPLAIEQSELARISTELADAFAAQAEQSLPAPTTDQQTAADSGAHDNPMQARLETAGKLVGEAQTDMQHAQGLLEAKTIQPQPLREAQTAALDKLARAIALFDEDRQNPQPQDSGQSQDSDGQQDEQSGQPADQGEDAAQSPREMAERGDLERLLQGVRDREARRRESRANHRGSGGYETVEKDW